LAQTSLPPSRAKQGIQTLAHIVRVLGSEFKVQGSFSVLGSWFGVLGSEFTVLHQTPNENEP